MADISTLIDSFSGTVLDTSKWVKTSYKSGNITVNDSLTLYTAGLSDSYVNVKTVNFYDLEGSSIYFSVRSFEQVMSFYIYNTPTTKTIGLAMENGSTSFSVNGVLIHTYTYTPTFPAALLYHRIREQSNVIYFDTSTDGHTFTNCASTANTDSWTSLKVAFDVVRVTDDPSQTVYGVNYVPPKIAEATGTLTFSGTPIRKYIARRGATGTLTFSGSTIGVVRVNPSVIEKKTFMWKVYDEDGTFLEVLDDVVDVPDFSEEINTVGSAMTITLARNSDSLMQATENLLDNTGATILDNNNFPILTTVEGRNKVGPGSSINHNNRIDLYVFYGETSPILDNTGNPILDSDGEAILGTVGAPNGICRFSGFISEINVKYGDDENTEVQLMSYGFDLDQYPVVDASGNTTVAFNSYDQGEMVRDALDQFETDGIGTYTTYTTATVQDTSAPASYTFKNNTYKELLDKAVQLAPVGWYYRVGLGDNLVHFSNKSLTAQHIFYLGKHIKSLQLKTYIGDVVNDVIFTGGGDPALFRRTTITPVARTRRGLDRQADSRVTLDASADLLADGTIDEQKNIQYRTTVSIVDRTYDIESINVGDVVGFANFDNQVDGITMQVVARHYTPDVVTLQLDSLPKSIPKRLEELRKQLNVTENQNVPIIPV